MIKSNWLNLNQHIFFGFVSKQKLILSEDLKWVVRRNRTDTYPATGDRSTILSYNHHNELTAGLEPTTRALQKPCSTIELYQQNNERTMRYARNGEDNEIRTRNHLIDNQEL